MGGGNGNGKESPVDAGCPGTYLYYTVRRAQYRSAVRAWGWGWGWYDEYGLRDTGSYTVPVLAVQ